MERRGEERTKLAERKCPSCDSPGGTNAELLADDFEEEVNGTKSGRTSGGQLLLSERSHEFNLSKVTRQMYRCTLVSPDFEETPPSSPAAGVTGQLAKKLGRRASEYLEKVIRLKGSRL